MNVKQQGNLGEAAVVLELIKRGYEVYSPTYDNATYDLIGFKDGKLFRIEVKSTNRVDDRYYIIQLKKVRSNKTQNKITNFDKSLVDLLGVYVVCEDKVLLIDSKDITTKTELRISKLES